MRTTPQQLSICYVRTINVGVRVRAHQLSSSQRHSGSSQHPLLHPAAACQPDRHGPQHKEIYPGGGGGEAPEQSRNQELATMKPGRGEHKVPKQ